MADDGAAQSTTAWPAPRFYFKVMWGSEVMSFQEVSGLDTDSEVVEYRRPDSQVFSAISLPGTFTFGKITLKKGILRSDSGLRQWYEQAQANTFERLPITISLLDEDGTPTMVWTLVNARPTKISSAVLDSEGNEVAIETIEIAHEGITIANPSAG